MCRRKVRQVPDNEVVQNNAEICQSEKARRALFCVTFERFPIHRKNRWGENPTPIVIFDFRKDKRLRLLTVN